MVATTQLRRLGIGLGVVGILCIWLWRMWGDKSPTGVLLKESLEFLEGKQPVIRASCNGEQIRLILDTGTGYHIALFKGQEKQTQLFQQAILDGRTYDGAPLYRLPYLRVQRAKVKSAHLVIAHIVGDEEFAKKYFKGTQGLLGFAFLKHFVTTIDWKSKRVTLSHSLSHDLPTLHVLPLKQVRFKGLRFPAINVRFGDKDLLCVLDTGSDISMLPASATEKFSYERISLVLRAVNSQGEQEAWWVGRVGPVTVGPLTIPTLVMQSPNLHVRPKAPSFLYQLISQGYGVIGCDVLHKFRLAIIDGPKSKVYFET
ncbi:MAG: hypothetical protein RMK49_07810 [Abditibacteriales bacterium]|nr:hypothetical protein [Abditibacteriales bacterium]